VNGLLFAAPALLFALLLAMRRFPGERQLVALASRRLRRVRRRAPVRVIAVARAERTLLPRGSALLARALAKRPPPLPLQA
jgi:hypothetical protein